MRKSRFTEARMVKILRETDKVPVAEAAKKRGLIERDVQSTWLSPSSESRADPLIVARAARLVRRGRAQSRSTKRRCGYLILFAGMHSHNL